MIHVLLPRALRPAFGVAALVTAVAAGPSATSAELSIDDLKGAYLACELAAAASKLGDDDVMRCSIMYEELKQQGFGGDFRSFRTWYESVRTDISS